MKQVFYVNLILFILLVISLSTSSARLLPQVQDEKEVKATNNIPHEGSFIMPQEDDFFHLMGLEDKCNENDDDCDNRRMVAEAHLDYIYTQHHKPKGLP